MQMCYQLLQECFIKYKIEWLETRLDVYEDSMKCMLRFNNVNHNNKKPEQQGNMWSDNNLQ